MSGFTGFADGAGGGAGTNTPPAQVVQQPIGGADVDGNVKATDPELVLEFAAKHRVPERVAKAFLRALGGTEDEDSGTLVTDLGLTPEDQVLEAVAAFVFEDGAKVSGPHRGAAMRLWRASSTFATLQGFGKKNPMQPVDITASAPRGCA